MLITHPTGHARGRRRRGRAGDGNHEPARPAAVREPGLRAGQAALPLLSERGGRAAAQALVPMNAVNSEATSCTTRNPYQQLNVLLLV